MASENYAVPAASSPSGGQETTLKSGVRVQPIQPGRTVKEVRAEWEAVFKIPKDAKAMSGGQTLSEDTPITPGMTLEFVRPSGEKG